MNYSFKCEKVFFSFEFDIKKISCSESQAQTHSLITVFPRLQSHAGEQKLCSKLYDVTPDTANN